MRLMLSPSLWRRLTLAGIAIAGLMLLFDANVFDPLEVAPPVDPVVPVASTPLLFTATAYCKGTTTASGIRVRSGIAAADPAILPLGSIINITTPDPKYQGLYTILDTGPAVQRRLVDLYMWSCYEALDFGRQQVELTVLRLGWDPAASAPSLIDRMFRRREAARNAAPPSPPAPASLGAHRDARHRRSGGRRGTGGAGGTRGTGGAARTRGTHPTGNGAERPRSGAYAVEVAGSGPWAAPWLAPNSGDVNCSW